MNPTIYVNISTTKDGSMLSRTNAVDPVIIRHRKEYLNRCNLSMQQTTRLRLALHDRLTSGETDFCRYLIVSEKDKGRGMSDTNIAIADALVTTDLNHALFLPVADCVATTFYDPIHKVLMLSHLGRHSLEQQGGARSIAFLQEHFNSDPKDLLVWSSPAPDKTRYPIWKLDHKGMKEAWFEQILGTGVLIENITDNPANSATDERYYSYSEYLKGHRSEDGDYAMVAIMKA